MEWTKNNGLSATSRRIPSLLARVLAGVALLVAGGTSAEEAGSYRVEPETLAIERTVHAQVRSDECPLARARVAGMLRTLEVDEGDRVAKAQVIARVEDPELASRIVAARAEVERVEARNRQAERQLSRAQELFREDNLSERARDQAREEARASAKALEAARAEVDTLLARRARGAVLAPAAGYVTEVRPTVGSRLQAGGFVARIAAEPVVVRVAVPERHLRHLARGDELTLATPEGARRTEVVKIYPDVERGRIEADLRLPEGVPALPLGRRVPVRLPVATAERLMVPRRLVSERHGLAFVERADGGRTLVQLGRAEGERVTILSGLRAGDVLIAP